jgi:hypothetical protein
VCGHIRESLLRPSLNSSKHTVTDTTISKITASTTVSALLSGLDEGSYCKVYKDNTQVSGDTIVGTGMVVKFMNGNTVKASYIVIVTGDTNGDGGISVTDMIAIKAHLLKKSTLTGASATAADANGDAGVSITDFIQLKAHVLGKSKVEAKSATAAPKPIAETNQGKSGTTVVAMVNQKQTALVPNKQTLRAVLISEVKNEKSNFCFNRIGIVLCLDDISDRFGGKCECKFDRPRYSSCW